MLLSVITLKNNFKNNIQIKGYAFECDNSPTNAGGVGLLVNNQYTYSIINTYNLNINAYGELWIEIDLPCNNKCIVSVITGTQSLNLMNFSYVSKGH